MSNEKLLAYLKSDWEDQINSIPPRPLEALLVDIGEFLDSLPGEYYPLALAFHLRRHIRAMAEQQGVKDE